MRGFELRIISRCVGNGGRNIQSRLQRSEPFFVIRGAFDTRAIGTPAVRKDRISGSNRDSMGVPVVGHRHNVDEQKGKAAT